MDEKLQEKREEAEKRKQELNRQWEELNKRQKELKDNFLEFDKLVGENENKRERAMAKNQKNSELIEKSTKGMKEIDEKIPQLTKIKERISEEINKHTIYEEFLQGVMKEAPQFKAAEDVIQCFIVLWKTNKELAEQLNAKMHKVEESRDKLSKQIQHEEYVLTGLNNKISQLQNRREAAEKKGEHWKSIIKSVKGSISKELDEVLETRQACWNLYNQVCSFKKIIPGVRKSDYEHQLLFVKKNLGELETIVKTAQTSVI